MRLVLAALAVVTWPLLATAQPAATQFYGSDGAYQGRAVEQDDGNTVLLFSPRGYAGRLQKGANGTWLRFGPNGGYQGRAVPGSLPFDRPDSPSRP